MKIADVPDAIPPIPVGQSAILVARNADLIVRITYDISPAKIKTI